MTPNYTRGSMLALAEADFAIEFPSGRVVKCRGYDMPDKVLLVYSAPVFEAKTHRMTFWRELRWVVASMLLGWVIDLVQREATRDTLQLLQATLGSMSPDPQYDTVRMRRPRAAWR